MRHLLAIGLLGLAATPAPAKEAPRPVAPPPPAAPVPPAVANGQVIDQLGTVVGSVTKALLNLPVGEVEAAIENRPATPADRAKTVRSVTGADERELESDIAQGTVAVKSGGQAVARALPVIVEALNRAGEDIERATANIPQPGYPRR